MNISEKKLPDHVLGCLVAGLLTTHIFTCQYSGYDDEPAHCADACCTHCCATCKTLTWLRVNAHDELTVALRAAWPGDSFSWQLPDGSVDWTKVAAHWGEDNCPFNGSHQEEQVTGNSDIDAGTLLDYERAAHELQLERENQGSPLVAHGTPHQWGRLRDALQFAVDGWRESNADTTDFTGDLWQVTLYGHRAPDGHDHIVTIGIERGPDVERLTQIIKAANFSES